MSQRKGKILPAFTAYLLSQMLPPRITTSTYRTVK